MNLCKIKTMVGFAVKSNKIIYGMDNIEKARGSLHLIMADDTVSEKTRLNLERLAQQKQAKLLVITQRVEDLVFKSNCKVIAILDKNLSNNIIKNVGNDGGNLID